MAQQPLSAGVVLESKIAVGVAIGIGIEKTDRDWYLEKRELTGRSADVP